MVKSTALAIPNIEADSPWGNCMTQFLEELHSKSGSAATVKNYRSVLHRFFATSANDGPPKSPDQYTRQDILWFVHRTTDSQRSRGKAPVASTINSRQATISSFYKFASSYTYLDSCTGHIVLLYDHANPTAGLSFRKVGYAYRAMSIGELTRLFAVIPKDTIKGLRDRALLLMYLHTARRRAEIANLRWGDLQEGVIVDTDGTRRVGFLFTFHGKGRSTIDDVSEMPLAAKAALDVYLEASGRRATMRPDSPLFTSSHHPGHMDQPLLADSIGFIMKAYLKKAGLDSKRITLHSLRHTAAHERFSHGEDLRSIQRLLRHSNIGVTDRYVALMQGSADPGALLVEGLFSKL